MSVWKKPLQDHVFEWDLTFAGPESDKRRTKKSEEGIWYRWRRRNWHKTTEGQAKSEIIPIFYNYELWYETMDGCIDNVSEMDTDRDGTDAEGADVGEGGDCDGDARFPHRLSDPLRQGKSWFLLVAQVAQALHDHEHVVNSNSCDKKGKMLCSWLQFQPLGSNVLLFGDLASNEFHDFRLG